MTKTEQLAAVVERLSEEQVDALLSLAQSMAEEPFYEKAPPEALASLERGLEQLARGETVSLDELSRRLEAAAKPTVHEGYSLARGRRTPRSQIAYLRDVGAVAAAERLRRAL